MGPGRTAFPSPTPIGPRRGNAPELKVEIIQLRRVDPGLQHHGMGLPAMVDLVLHQMQDQRADLLLHGSVLPLRGAGLGQGLLGQVAAEPREPQIDIGLRAGQVRDLRDLLPLID